MNDYTKDDKFVELISKIPNVAVQGYNRDRTVIYWNKASEEIYGYSYDEAFGKKLEDLIIPDFMKDEVISDIRDWYEDGVAIPTGELPLKHKDGSTVYVFSSHVMLKEDTKEPEMFCVDINLTEQKKQEELLRKKDNILVQQSKMASMGEMFENIAHQWREPLSMISATASGIQLQNEFKILDETYLNNTLNSIIENSQYLSQTINDFRDFIKGEHKKIPFNIYDNIVYSLKLLKGVTNKNEINIIMSENGQSIKICNYPNELVQVVINIINNSKDAFLKNDTRKRCIFIDISESSNQIKISIKDNADGINKNYIDKIFEQGFTTKEDKKGTGIGLYMSKRLVNESMKGNIEVKNTKYTYKNIEFSGAEFTIVLNKD